MNYKRIFLIGLLLGSLSCNKKNDTSDIRPYKEVVLENDTAIRRHLSSHFYQLNDKKEVVFGKIEGVHATKEPVINKVKEKILRVRDYDGNYVNHTMYYIILQEGTGEQATIADRSFMSYTGRFLSGVVFDKTYGYSLSNWLNLFGENGNSKSGNGGVTLGFREAVALLKDSASNATIAPDGSLNVPSDGGVGVFFMPAGIGYYNGSGVIPAYSPLIFEINLIKSQRLDHDSDGIPTIKEIVHQPDGTILFPDCNNNDRADYLDNSSCEY